MGRPPLGVKPINLRLPPELIDIIDREAKAQDITRAELIRRILTYTFKGHLS